VSTCEYPCRFEGRRKQQQIECNNRYSNKQLFLELTLQLHLCPAFLPCRENIQQMILGNMNIMDPAGW
jgi:hypothetical protein